MGGQQTKSSASSDKISASTSASGAVGGTKAKKKTTAKDQNAALTNVFTENPGEYKTQPMLRDAGKTLHN